MTRLAQHARRALDVAAARRRLAKVEALAERAGTAGEAIAANAAAHRLRALLVTDPQAPVAGSDHADSQQTFALADAWSGRLLAALCRRYGIEPEDDGRDGTMTVRAPRVFLETILVPEFERVRTALAGLVGELKATPAPVA